jgi:hypothetical protein
MYTKFQFICINFSTKDFKINSHFKFYGAAGAFSKTDWPVVAAKRTVFKPSGPQHLFF